MSGVRLLVAVAGAMAIGGCVSMDPSVVDPESYLGSRSIPHELYGHSSTPTLLPVLDVRIEPMDGLFLINFDDDPVYEGVELQTFAGTGPQVRVLLWRADTVDVYDSPGRTFDEARDRIALEALLSPRAVTHQRATFDYRFRVGEHGLDAALRMTDRDGRDIVVEVVETRGEPVVGGLIAPVGASSAAPDYLPVFFLDEFALVKRAGTRIRIEVDGRPRTLSKMTRLVRGPASYFSRYSTRVLIAHWNERREAVLEPVAVEPGAEHIEVGGLEWRIRWNAGRPEVSEVIARSDGDVLTFEFSPALPDLAALRPGAKVEGRFVINVNDTPGIVAGEYSVDREEGRARLTFHPVDAWQPPIVRGPSWVSFYLYTAEIDLDAPVAQLRSRWSRS